MKMRLFFKGNVCYILLHFEQVFNNFFLDKSINRFDDKSINLLDDKSFNNGLLWSEKGIYQKSFTQLTVLKIKNEIGDFSKFNNTWTYVFDLKCIKLIEGNDLIVFEELLDELTYHKHRWLLVNAEKGIKVKGREPKDSCIMSSIDVFKNEDCQQYRKNLENVFNEDLEAYVRSCSYEYNRKSISSRVYLSKYIDIKKMMEDLPFFCLCLYKLALVLCEKKVLKIDNYKENKNKSIFIHTMNGAVMGSILAQLYCIDSVIVDHLGPYNKLYVDDLSATIDRHKKYIVVSDVVCMGAELKVAKTILDVLGVQYECCAAMVEIQTVNDSTNEDKVFSLYQVTKEHNTLGYYVDTDLSNSNRGNENG